MCPSPSSSAHRCAASLSHALSLVLVQPPSPSLSPLPAVSPVPSSSPPPLPGLHPLLSSPQCCHSSFPLESEPLCRHFDNATIEKENNYCHTLDGVKDYSLYRKCIIANVSVVIQLWFCQKQLFESETIKSRHLPYWSPFAFPATSSYSAEHRLSTAGCGFEGCWLSVASPCWLVLRQQTQRMKVRLTHNTVSVWFGFESFNII